MLLVGACAATEDRDASVSDGPDLLDADNFIADICEGGGGRFNLFRYSTGVICDSIFDGLAAGFASMGRNQPKSRFCVARGFQVEGYKKKVLKAMREETLEPKARLALMLSDVQQDAAERGECDWEEAQTLGPLSESCSWFEIVQARDPERAAQKRMSEEGIYNARDKREIIGGAMAHCSGYIMGFLMAEMFAVELAQEPGYCSNRKSRSWKVEIPEVAEMAVDLTSTVESQPERRGEPAGPYLYKLVAKKPSCPAAGDS